MALSDSTLLVISAIGVPPYSARGLTQTLEPIPASQNLRRTVNGELADVSATQFRKYRSVITCTDQQPPAMSAAWPGLELTVDCIAELAYLTATGSPDRVLADVDSGSEASRVEDDFTFYRPQLTMRLVTFRTQTDEYGATVAWSLELEEI